MAQVIVNGKLLGETKLSFRDLRKLAQKHKWKYQSWEEGELLHIETTDSDVMLKIK
ncbi:U exon [Bat mastadenovirus]|uniref:U exon n=1 Tax=Bat mastadenovirus TaxID=740971 RepID=A0A3G9EWN5_9ADEN|nr:U exon [Bat mastadenovirus]BBE29321.1 U exon [Bat mastadenovirus]